jgi:hypothetical protein
MQTVDRQTVLVHQQQQQQQQANMTASAIGGGHRMDKTKQGAVRLVPQSSGSEGIRRDKTTAVSGRKITTTPRMTRMTLR